MKRQMLRIRVLVVAIVIALTSIIALGPRAAMAGDATGGGHSPLVATLPPIK